MPSESFVVTGAFEEFVVPDDVHTLTFDGRGASGGNGGQGTAVGGNGGRVVCDVPVIPGETLRVFVGERGDDGDGAGATVNGGFNGGGDGTNTGAGGGGWSDLRRAPYGIEDSLCGAPGGGGAANSATGNSAGGYGGTPAGLNGFQGNGSTGNRGAHGGGAARGAPGRSLGTDQPGTNGGPGQGGDGGTGAGSGAAARGGAGGGGGYAGGAGGEGGVGSGNTGGGGGGGCGLSTGINETIIDDENTGDGEITLSWTVDPDPGQLQVVSTGSYTALTVPDGITLLVADLYGAEGAAPLEPYNTDEAVSGGIADAASPGKGGRVQCDLTVTPGEILRVYVGGRGIPGSSSGAVAGGFNGGGDGPLGGGSGGGATDVRRSPYGLADRLAVAPAGGGAGGGNMDSPFSLGGDGATPTGGAGVNGGVAGVDGSGGAGGTAAAGGAGGAGSGTAPNGAAGSAGALGLGGDGGAAQAGQARGGGGGGAGRYGGGGGGGGTAAAGGSGGGGAGGSGLSSGVGETLESGVWSGFGLALLSWDVGPTPPVDPPVEPPTDDELLDLTFGVRSSTFQYVLLDAANQQVGYIDIDVTGGPPVIGNDIGRTIHRTMNNLVLPPSTQAEINPLVHRIMPQMVLSNGSFFPLGVFLFADLSGKVHSRGDFGHGTMGDQGIILDQPSDASIGFQPGTLLADAIGAVFTRAGLTIWSIDPDITGVIGAPVAWPAGTHWSVAAGDLCDLAGAYHPYFDNRGIITVRPVDDLPTATPDLEYWTDRRSRIYDDSTTISSDVLDAPNRYIVIDGAASQSPIVAKYDIPDNAPHSRKNRGFYVPKVIRADGLESVAAAQAQARAAYASTGGAAFEHVQFSTPPDPRHDTFDVIAYNGVNYLEQSWSMPLSDGGDMTHHLRRSYIPTIPGSEI